ncbi:MarR family winged helix-turn-helix transcriptional regulator [Lentilactobacillus sp. SPB1-3]|uniref:MarR family winged helix-turn-helix transcriptional regulator n=1 Tax=Lentilactobacillus terminaliae TaxID=3003483 RepID=A0ACD5DFB4_9LACO|nr:MarR family transcriptional regulator [Lentilactobacillus sp. SPB1-3]MCZ0976329.1 MarR family transcriptional regulator [Lentilactobacillus sp. SPB1-3]
MSKASEINYLMRTINVNMQRKYERETRDFNISRSQSRALSYIHGHPGLNQTQLAEAFNMRAASISGILKSLEKSAYIEKHALKGTQDRSKKIYITPTGEQATNKISDIFQDTENQSMSGLTDTEADQLIALLSKVADSMEAPEN